VRAARLAAMTDYRRPIAFGIFPVPNAADLDTIFEAARMADEGGLDLIGIQDHPYHGDRRSDA
jgi:hypothetical protein